MTEDIYDDLFNLRSGKQSKTVKRLADTVAVLQQTIIEMQQREGRMQSEIDALRESLTAHVLSNIAEHSKHDTRLTKLEKH